MTAEATTRFDIDLFKRAYESWDVEALLDMYADDAELIQIDRNSPPSSPRTRHGKEVFRDMFEHCAAVGARATIENTVAEENRAAATITCEFPGGRKVVANSSLDLDGGRIVRERAVQAGDPKYPRDRIADRGSFQETVTEREEKRMPKASKETASEHETVEGYEGHFEHFEGGWTVGFETYTQDADLTPFFKGLPDDQCQCEHMGYVITGKVAFHSNDGEEVFEAGDAYRVGPGHTPVLYAGSEVVEFSPTEELGKTMEVVTKNMEEMEAASS